MSAPIERADWRRVCICTTTEIQSGRYYRGCLAHAAEIDPDAICHHTDREGCTGHGDF